MAQEDAHKGMGEVAESLGYKDKVSRPLTIVFLGAGSGFVEPLFNDILQTPGATGEFRLVDIDERRLELAHKIVQHYLDYYGRSDWTITSTTDRRQALPGADYVISCVEVSGIDCVAFDYEIPLKYGVDQCIGDTGGPGGLMKALRTVPVWLDIVADIEELCPDAYVFNYTNPMSIMCLSTAMVSDANVFGFCHSVQGDSRGLAKAAGIGYDELEWECAGVNHLAWFTRLMHNGEDLYPMLHDKARTDKEWYEGNPVRCDMMLEFGYWISESSGHLSEYLPYYRKRDDLKEKYLRDKYRGGSGFYATEWPKWRKGRDEGIVKALAGEKEFKPGPRSHEYASYCIEAIETNRPFVAHLTVPNTGLISNLPAGVVEVACLCNRTGITPTYYGELPPHCATLCEWNMRMYELAAIACVERDREAAVHSLMVDPLTAAVCSPAEIRAMAEELFEAEKKFMPEGF